MISTALIKPKDSSEVLHVATEFYGEERSKQLFHTIFDTVQEVNYRLTPPVAPINNVKFLFVQNEEVAGVRGIALVDNMTIGYVLSGNQPVDDQTAIAGITHHESSHLIRHQYRLIEGHEVPHDIFSWVIDEGIALLAEEQHAGIAHSWFEPDEAFYAEVDGIVMGARDRIKYGKCEAFLNGTDEFPNKGCAIGYVVASMISETFGISARDMMAMDDAALHDLARKTI